MIDLSVIIPTCDRPMQLRRALESVAAQTTGLSCECIIADDGSNGKCGEVRSIVASFDAQYCSTGGGKGGGEARNRGAAVAQGAFLAFLDDDDAWEPGKLSEQVPLMATADTGLSYTGLTIIGTDGSRRYSFRKPRHEHLYRSICRKNFIGTTSSVMVRREVFEAVGGFDPTLPALQDYDFYIRLLRKYPITWTASPLTIYYSGESRDHVSESLTRFRKATALLLAKYRSDPLLPLLRRSFSHITLLKCVRSRRFLVEYLRALLKGR